ncbi:MAG: ATP-binding protein, partial [Acidimicrobiales bacterium]
AGLVEAGGAPVLVGRCTRDAPTPYEPFLEALGPTRADRSGSWLADHAAGPRSRLVAAIAAAVHDGRETPVLLVLEDLHWATASTVLVLDRLARQHPSPPLLVVATYRDSAIQPNHPLSRFLGDPLLPRPVRIFLDSLPAPAVATLLVDRAAVAGPSAASLASALWKATEGHPLVLTEQIRELAAARGLAGGRVDWRRIDRIGIAHTVDELVGRKLRAGGARMRAVLEVAATIGPVFDSGLVVEICGWRDEVAGAALSKAVASSLVAPVDGPPGRYRFIHDMVRDAVYAGIGVNRQVRLQRELADVLETPAHAGGVSPAVLVHHLAAATPVGRSPEAVDHAVAAGRAAMDLLAFEEAAAYFGQALGFLGGGGDDHAAGRRCDLLMMLGDAYHLADESARARQSFLQAAAIAHGHKDGPRLGRAVLGLGEALETWGADSLLIGLLDDAVEANTADPSLQAMLVARLAQACAAFDSPDERKDHSDRAWELAWDSRDPDTMGAVLRARHEALSSPDDLEDRVEIDGELVAMAKSSDDPRLTLLAHGWRVVDLLEQGHVSDADADRRIHADAAGQSGDARHVRDAALWAATWAMLAGRPDEASTHIDEALELGERIHDPASSSAYWTQQFGLLLDWGTDDELDGLLDVWREVVRSHDRTPVWRSSLALLLLRQGHHEEARSELDDLVAEEGADLALDRDWLPTVAAMGEVAAVLHDPRAPLLAGLLLPYARRLVVVGHGLACRGSVARVLGMLNATAGKWAQAERHFQAALTMHEAAGAVALVARTRSDFGRALAAKEGGPLHIGRVKTTLEQAAKEAARCKMPRLVAETRSARRRVA